MRPRNIISFNVPVQKLCCLFILLTLLGACTPTPSPLPSPTPLPKPAVDTKSAYPVHIPYIGQSGATVPAPTVYPAVPAGKATAGGTQAAAVSFNLEILKNLEYNLPDLPGGKARLQNGMFSAKAPSGSTGDTNLKLANSASGDLNKDGKEDAAAILVLNMGGSGSFYTLAAVLSESNGARHVASASLGDRVVIKSIAISGGLIRLEMTIHGPNDPLCCPSQPALKQFRLHGMNLEEVK